MRRNSSRPYEVVFYAPWIGPLLAHSEEAPPGGAETQILLLSEALARRGHRVALVTYGVGVRLPTSMAGVDIIVQRRPRTTRPFLRTFDYALSLAATLLSLRTDILVQRAAGTTTGMVAILTKLRRGRFVYSSANVVDFRYEELERSRRNVALFHLGVRLADKIIVQTTEQDALCRRRFDRSAEVIKSVAETAEKQELRPEAFLWIGRMVHYKQPAAFLELARNLPEAQFRMVAVATDQEGERMLEELNQVAVDLDNLEVLPPFPRLQLAQLIGRAVAIVNTSAYEGMPNIYLEGWARGVPALALSHDPDGVIMREGIGAFAGGDVGLFTQQARALWDGRCSREVIAERCIHYIKREHAPETIVARWEHALDLAPSRGSAPSNLSSVASTPGSL